MWFWLVVLGFGLLIYVLLGVSCVFVYWLISCHGLLLIGAVGVPACLWVVYVLLLIYALRLTLFDDCWY